ncbi:MAG: hypothetical protein JNG41_07330 [Dialister sp.]|nr:hypothetical protein [Dialister sp.]
MSKKGFAAATKAAMGKAAAEALLNAQKVDASIITDECGKIAIRKSPWNDAEIISDNPKVIPGRLVCSGGDFGDQLDFKPYAQTGEKKYTEIIHTSHGALRTSPQRVFASFSFPKEMNKADIMKYLYKEVLEMRGKVKKF